jgi:hypothetical protein
MLIKTRGTIEDHISKVETVLTGPRDTRLKVNEAKSFSVPIFLTSVIY